VLVGDPGTRSVTIDSSQVLTQLFVSDPFGPSAPFPVDVAGDGTFSLPAGMLSWQGDVLVPTQTLQQTVSCATFTITTQSFTQSVSLAADGDATGVLDPATDVVQVDLDGTLTAGDVAIPFSFDVTGCLTSHDTATLACSFDSVPTHIDLDGDGNHGTDVGAGILALSDPSVGSPLTPTCSGGGVLGDSLALLVDLIDALYADGLTGALTLDATMTPGAHSPAAPRFGAAPSLTGSPEVGALLTCTPGSLTGVPDPLVTFSWLRNGAPITGSTASTYTVQPIDAEQSIACAVHAVNDSGSDDKLSNALVIAEPAASGGGSGADGGAPAAPEGSGTPAGTQPPAPAAASARCVVPELRGLKLRKAKRKLRKAHCRAGKVRKVRSKKAKKGRVIKTKPAAGKRKPAGTRVKLIVAR
jgi:hypothetical protein